MVDDRVVSLTTTAETDTVKKETRVGSWFHHRTIPFLSDERLRECKNRHFMEDDTGDRMHNTDLQYLNIQTSPISYL